MPLSPEIYEARARVGWSWPKRTRLEQTNAQLSGLVEAEAAASKALRQANHDLGIAYRELRASQGQLARTSSVAAPLEAITPASRGR